MISLEFTTEELRLLTLSLQNRIGQLAAMENEVVALLKSPVREQNMPVQALLLDHVESAILAAHALESRLQSVIADQPDNKA